MTVDTSTCWAPTVEHDGPVRPYVAGPLCSMHAPWRRQGLTQPPVAPPHGLIPAAARAATGRTPTPPDDDPAPAATAPHSAAGQALVARVLGAAGRAPRHAADPYVREGQRATSMAAAVNALPRSGTQRRAILDALWALHQRTPGGGATDVQLARHLDLPGNSVRPRRGELVEMGLVEDAGRTVTHDGNPHTVWRVTNAAAVALHRA